MRFGWRSDGTTGCRARPCRFGDSIALLYPLAVAAVAGATLVGCGSSPPPSTAPEPPAADPEAPALGDIPTSHAKKKPAPAAPVSIPEACATEEDGFCLPSQEFVEKLCAMNQATVALTLFRKGTVWTRAYVRPMQVEAWYASGGRSEPAKLTFAEELIVLARRNGAAGGIQVSGAGSYDVFRWDGSCVSVMSDEITLRRPGNPDVATIRWNRLDPDVQTALESNTKIAFRLEARRKACAEVGPGSDKKCARADQGLSRMIGEHVRGGGEVPVRANLP